MTTVTTSTTHPTILKLIETGIPLKKVTFQSAVNNADNTPENYFSLESLNASRRARMWSHPMWNFILCLQINLRGEEIFFMVPIANCIFGHFTKYESQEDTLNPIIDTSTDSHNEITKKRGRPFKNTGSN